MNKKVGAIIAGGDFHGLGIARSLGRRGIPVCILDDEYSIGQFSKYATLTLRTRNLRDADEMVSFLLDAGRRKKLEGWVLFPTRDEHVAAFARHRTALLETFRVPTPEWDVVKWAWNKWNTYCLAKRLKIPTPRTWCPRNADELDEIDAEFPLGVKPAVKENFFYATKKKAWRANNRRELLALFEKARQYVGEREVLIQEIIPGTGDCQFSSCVFFKNGEAVATMSAQRWRQHPQEFGRAATFVETIELPAVEEPTIRFLRGMGYYGLAEIEYKLDPRDGEYKLLDVNTRTWGFHSLGPAAGVDFPYLLYADQIGERIPVSRGRPGIGWIRMVTDFPTSLLAIFGGRLAPRTYLQSLKSFSTESVFSREDILPSVIEIALIPYLTAKRGF